MSTEVVVALIAAGGIIMAGGVGALTAYLTGRHQARAQAETVTQEFLADREKLLWDQAGKFWDERAEGLVRDVTLERSAREAETAALKADIALLKQDSLKLNQAHQDCEATVKSLEVRLIRAGEQLRAEVAEAVEAEAQKD